MSIDRDAGYPVYEQIAETLRARIADGTLTRRVPSIIDVARELGVARNTSHQALQLLSDWGLAKPRIGQGYYLRPGARARAQELADVEDCPGTEELAG
jgi:DNA-binding transcriptional regulator YhcF (GntR family)